jgi:hypothetical protein
MSRSRPTTGLLPELATAAKPHAGEPAPSKEAHREQVIRDAYNDGKITASRMDDYRRMYDRDPVGTQLLINALGSGLAPGAGGDVKAEGTGLLSELNG